MLETKFKVMFLLAVLAFAAIPIMGILRGTTLTPFEVPPADSTNSTAPESLNSSQAAHEEPVSEEMISIPAGPFIRGTDHGGFDERPQRTLILGAFTIDRYETTNFQYQQFVDVTGHRKSGPPARYAKNMGKMLTSISLWSMCHGRMLRPIAIGKGNGFRLRLSGRKLCEDRMDGCGLGVMLSSPTEPIGRECRMAMKSPQLSGWFRLIRARTV